MRGTGRTLAPATLNRYSAAIAAVFTWGVRRRIAPKGWIHPCRGLERPTENNEKTRFLTKDELGLAIQRRTSRAALSSVSTNRGIAGGDGRTAGHGSFAGRLFGRSCHACLQLVGQANGGGAHAGPCVTLDRGSVAQPCYAQVVPWRLSIRGACSASQQPAPCGGSCCDGRRCAPTALRCSVPWTACVPAHLLVATEIAPTGCRLPRGDRVGVRDENHSRIRKGEPGQAAARL